MKFDSSFFEDEYRNDFFIPQMMKRAWAAKLELLQIIIDICHSHNLTYFAAYGTLLGAVRHKGFIPWDDDIDIMLKRADYNQLLQVLPKELPAGFALAGLYSKDSAFFLPTYQSLVVTIPSFWSLSDYMERFHGFPYRGMGIDIFPLDNYPDDANAGQVQTYLIQKIALTVQNWSTYDSQTKTQQLAELESLCNVSISLGDHTLQQLLQLQDSIRTLYSDAESHYLAYDDAWILGKAPINKDWYCDVISVPFENISIDIPKHYDELLTYAYGNYMEPVVSHGTHTYPFYINEERAMRNYLDSHGYSGSIDQFVKEHYSD